MTNSKTIVFIVTFAVVAALLTLYRNPELLMNKLPHDEMVVTSTPPMPMTGGVTMGNAGAMPATQTFSITEAKRVPAEATMDMVMPSSPAMIMPRPYYGDSLSVENRVYMNTAYQGLLVSNMSEYLRQAKDYIQSNGGKVIHISQYTTDGMQYAYIDARLPAEKFDEATSLFASRAKKVMNQSLDNQDVTGQKKSMDDELLKLEEKKAAKATELSAATTELQRTRIQNEIDQINEQIEFTKTSQASFTENIKYSTVNLTISDSERYFNPEMSGGYEQQFKKAVYSLKATAKVLAIFFIWVAVYSIIWLPIVLFVRWVWRKLQPTTHKNK
jgi:hypothetical protein